MTFIDKNSSSHTAQSVTLYLQKWENQRVEVRRAPRLRQPERLKATLMRKQIILSNERLVCEHRRHRLLYFLRRVAAPFLLLQKKIEAKTLKIKLWAQWSERLANSSGLIQRNRKNRKLDWFPHKPAKRPAQSWKSLLQTDDWLMGCLWKSRSPPAGGALWSFTFLHANMQLT